ncbi:MAG: hypothetical protein LBU76_10350 [Azoarcus sp.]|jgi:hypothetical protein|nr:hypothetical protein [Azoarcus sp.]
MIVMLNKKWFLSAFCCFFCVNVFAQTSIFEPSQEPTAPYRLFETKDAQAFVVLETAVGRLWLVKVDVKDNERSYILLQEANFADGRERIHGRFTLHPTEDIYVFLLIDQIDDKMWEVQFH